MAFSSDSSGRNNMMIPSFLYGTSTKTLPLNQILNSASSAASSPAAAAPSSRAAGFMIPSPKESGKIEMYSPAFYAACTAGGILSCGLTHMTVTPLDLVKCNMQHVPGEDTHLITGSGDQTCVLWDITTGLRTSVFGGEFQSGHTADVLSISINGSNPKMFVSGSCDATARLWDTRVASRAVRTFHGHEGDVNTVKFFPDGNRFGTGSDDGTCRLFDIRTGHQLQLYDQQHSDNEAAHVTSIAFSISGRLLFAGYTNGDCYVWDTLLAKVIGALV